MLDKLGTLGVVGVIVLLGGVGVVAMESLVLAGGLALVLVGLALTAWGMVQQLLVAMGMDGMV